MSVCLCVCVHVYIYIKPKHGWSLIGKNNNKNNNKIGYYKFSLNKMMKRRLNRARRRIKVVSPSKMTHKNLSLSRRFGVLVREVYMKSPVYMKCLNEERDNTSRAREWTKQGVPSSFWTHTHCTSESKVIHLVCKRASQLLCTSRQPKCTLEWWIFFTFFNTSPSTTPSFFIYTHIQHTYKSYNFIAQ